MAKCVAIPLNGLEVITKDFFQDNVRKVIWRRWRLWIFVLSLLFPRPPEDLRSYFPSELQIFFSNQEKRQENPDSLLPFSHFFVSGTLPHLLQRLGKREDTPFSPNPTGDFNQRDDDFFVRISIQFYMPHSNLCLGLIKKLSRFSFLALLTFFAILNSLKCWSTL